MKPQLPLLIAVGVVAGLAQYLWLRSIPAFAEHAVGVAVSTTVVCCLLAAFFALRAGASRTLQRAIVEVLACAIGGAVAGTVAYWWLAAMTVPEGASNTLAKYPSSAIGLTLLLTGGWVVGLFCGIVRWLPMRRAQ